MFFQGDLQSGISAAIQQQKLVACFVRQEDDTESSTWETEWLQDSSVAGLFSDKAVLLRIEAGSQEAGFLSAFCSLERIPKLLIISNGSVLEDIESGVSEEDFISRVIAVLDPKKIKMSARAAGKQPSVSDEPESQAGSTVGTGQDQVASLLAERSARLEKIKREKEQAEREARKVIANARKQEADKAAGEASALPQSRKNWIEQQRTRQQEAKSEKARVLKMIESDKAARREREQSRKQQGQAETSSSAAAAEPTQPRAATSATSCSLQIRLFDGSSLRSRFSPDATLSTSVRTYVSEQSQTEIPYNFRLMQAPKPSRTIDISEENESLLSLGLCPSATLVLVPVKDYTDAYASSGATGIVYRGVNMGYNVVSGALGLVGGLVGRVTGYGGDATADGPYMGGIADEQEPSNVQGARLDQSSQRGGPSSGINIRTLADQRPDEDKTELYNGNQLNFEPRRDENKKD